MAESEIVKTEFSEYIPVGKERHYKCIMCGKPATLIEIYSEGAFCSEECCKDFYEYI